MFILFRIHNIDDRHPQMSEHFTATVVAFVPLVAFAAPCASPTMVERTVIRSIIVN